MKRPLKLFTFALTALLSSSVYAGAPRSQVSVVPKADTEYHKVFMLGQQAAEVAAKVGVAQVTLNNDKIKKAYQKRAAHACVRGTADALENLNIDTLLQEQNIGWFQRKYVEAKVNEVIYKLRALPVPSLSTKHLSQIQKEVLRESYQFAEHAINQSITIGLNVGVIADEQKRKEFGKRFADEFARGVEKALGSLDIKTVAERLRIALADNQIETVKNDMQKQIKRMRETIESGALGEFLSVQQ